MQKVVFIELPVNRKEHYIADIVELLFSINKTVHIYSNQSEKLRLLDRLLWIKKPDNFLPHCLVDPSINDLNDLIEPIWLINRPLNQPADALVLADPLSVNQIGNYELIIDFAELFDQNRLQKSRQRYKAFRDSGRFELSFEKLGSFLKLIKAS